MRPNQTAPRSRSALPISESIRGLHVRTLHVRPPDVVFVKSILEASEGLGSIFAEQGGELTIGAHPSRIQELDAFLTDIAAEVRGTVETPKDESQA